MKQPKSFGDDTELLDPNESDEPEFWDPDLVDELIRADDEIARAVRAAQPKAAVKPAVKNTAQKPEPKGTKTASTPGKGRIIDVTSRHRGRGFQIVGVKAPPRRQPTPKDFRKD